MRTYIINLTNNLIDAHRFEEMECFNCDQFVLYIKQVLGRPSAFGMYTLREGLARYAPRWTRACRSRRLASRSSP